MEKLKLNNMHKETSFKKLSSILTGASGEYFVAAELSRRGYIASITLRNTRGIDILCSNSDATKHVSIQVKTSNQSGNEWMLDKKSEEFFSAKHFYVFVSLNSENPKFFVVPSKVVARYTKTNHAEWIKGKKKDGKSRKDTQMRKFRDMGEKYLNRWDILGLDKK